MGGTRVGGIHAAKVLRDRYGKDYYKQIGAIGGRRSRGGGFASGVADPVEAGRRGGANSRRTRIIDPEEPLREDEMDVLLSLAKRVSRRAHLEGHISIGAEQRTHIVIMDLGAQDDWKKLLTDIKYIGTELTKKYRKTILGEELSACTHRAASLEEDNADKEYFKNLRAVCKAYELATGDKITITKG